MMREAAMVGMPNMAEAAAAWGAAGHSSTAAAAAAMQQVSGHTPRMSGASWVFNICSSHADCFPIQAAMISGHDLPWNVSWEAWLQAMAVHAAQQQGAAWPYAAYTGSNIALGNAGALNPTHISSIPYSQSTPASAGTEFPMDAQMASAAYAHVLSR